MIRPRRSTSAFCLPPSALRCASALLLLLLAQGALAQSIFTYSGGGTTEGMQATGIDLVGPRGLAIDPAGNVYIAETDGNTVQRVDSATGVIARFAGNGGGSYGGDGGPARRASLKRPWGLAFDESGNLFIADRDNGRVRRVDAATGIITTFAGRAFDPSIDGIGDGGPATAAFLRSPIGLAWRNGELYIADAGYDANRIRKVDRNGIITTVAGNGQPGFTGDGGPAAEASLAGPLGVAVDAAGNVYIADTDNGRIRKVDATTKRIETIAGGGMPPDGLGDGLPATGAALDTPSALAFDPAGALFIADTNHGRIRRYDAASKILTTVAGNGDYSGGDGGAATNAGLNAPFAIAFDRKGNLFVEDTSNGSIRRIDAGNKSISTVAGGGTYIGDGRVAAAAILLHPRGLAFDAKGNLLIADSDHALIRRVDTATGVISTYMGKLFQVYAGKQDGLDRRDAIAGYVFDLAVDKAGNVFAADLLNNVIWRIDPSDKVFRYAGGNDADAKGDNGPALAASFRPDGIGLDTAGNLYIADAQNHSIRRIDAKTTVITTVAGNGKQGFAGDGAAATQAQLDSPIGVVVDRRGNLFISDTGNGAIRRVDAATGTITTYAGRGQQDSGNGDGGPAANAVMTPERLAIDPNNDDLYVADGNGYRLRKIDARTQTITTIAGSGSSYADGDFSGDNGPAAAAKLNFAFDTSGIAIDSSGSVYVADTTNDRVRVVSFCAAIGAPSLVRPADGSVVSTAPGLAWTAVDDAFRYDVLLDTANPPQRVIAPDISETSFAPANLQPGTRYYWRVAAKGDPFCPSSPDARSPIASFTTTGSCASAVFDLVSPANNATIASSPVQLAWQSAGDGATYDVYLGTVRPVPLVASGLTATTYGAPIASGAYAWFVVSHPACDPSKASTTATRLFQSTIQSGCVPGQLKVTASQPANGATGVATTVDLAWSVTGVASSFDVYFGTSPDELTLFASDVEQNTQTISALEPATTYYWLVLAKGPCDDGVSSTPARFTTRGCAAAGATSIVFAPATVSEGTTYAIVWSPAPGLDSDGGYLVERSTSPSFSTILDSQLTSSTAASFLAGAPGTCYHRVRALPGCDPSKGGPLSDVKAVSVIAAKPNVVFTVSPTAVITALREHLEDKRGTFTLENIGAKPLQVLIGRQELNGSAPFFTIIDPTATDSAFVTLEPRRPKTFDIRYAGPRNDVSGSFQGVIFVASTGEGLSVTPYAFVNLKVGGGASAKPEFLIGDTPADYAAFQPLTGDDAARPPLSVSIRNSGTTPMELAAEIGPEVWLVPEASWNATALAPGAVRTVNLFTRRSRAPNGSPLPRYTYFGVRTKDGATARLLVQDSEELPLTAGRTIRLDSAARSFIIPEVVSRTTARGSPLVSQLRLSNVGGGAVQAELIFTPEGADGFSAEAVKRAVVIVPANDVVTLTDPLVQIFRVARPVRGAIEVRIPSERLGLLRVTASIVAQGSGGFVIPVVTRGDGARVSSPHGLGRIVGLTGSGATTTSLTLAETTGVDKVTVRLTLFDGNGAQIGQTTTDVPAYGMRHFDNVLAPFNRQLLDAGRLEIAVSSGGGAVIGIASAGNNDGGATYVSSPLTDNASSSIVVRAFLKQGSPNATSGSKVVIPVLAPPTSAGSAPAYRTGLSLVAPPGSPSTFYATLLDAGGATTGAKQTINLAGGATKSYADVIKDLFGKTSGSGSVFVEPPSGGKVYAVLEPTVMGSGAASPSALPLLTTLGEALTSAASSAQRPLFYDGVEQSVDATRGSRWLLVLNEVSGASGLLNVRLYEPGNRTSPIATKDVLIAPFQQMQLDTVFGALGLDAADHRKDRTNVEVVVTALGGAARVAAMAVSIDNATGDTKTYVLAPTVGSGTSTGSKVVAIVPQPLPTPSRRRAAGRP